MRKKYEKEMKNVKDSTSLIAPNTPLSWKIPAGSQVLFCHWFLTPLSGDRLMERWPASAPAA